MIQKVIYRRKAESLAPGRACCLITFFGGWMYEWGSSRGPTSTLSPSRPRPCGCPISKQGPSFSCCWRGNPLFPRRDWWGEQERLWRVGKKGRGWSPGSWDPSRGARVAGPPGKDHSCFWEGEWLTHLAEGF